MSIQFGDWLALQLRRRDMSQLGLANMMGTRSSTVNNWIKNHRVPSVESCWAIADALDLLPSVVMQVAGYPIDDEVAEDGEDRLIALWRKLSPEGKEDVMQFVEFRRGRERRDA